MGKNSVKKMASKVITKLGVKSASIAASQTCAMFYYQPKAPNKNLLMTTNCKKK